MPARKRQLAGPDASGPNGRGSCHRSFRAGRSTVLPQWTTWFVSKAMWWCPVFCKSQPVWASELPRPGPVPVAKTNHLTPGKNHAAYAEYGDLA